LFAKPPLKEEMEEIGWLKKKCERLEKKYETVSVAVFELTSKFQVRDGEIQSIMHRLAELECR
jgi:archaellum component FlaC